MTVDTSPLVAHEGRDEQQKRALGLVEVGDDALHHLQPVGGQDDEARGDINTADFEMLLRVPGLGTKSAWLIVNSRRFNRLTSFDLKKMGVVMKKAKYFITCHELDSVFDKSVTGINELSPERLRPLLVSKTEQKLAAKEKQLSLEFGDEGVET